MPRCTVRIDNTETYLYQVDADSPEAAEALDIFESDDRESGYSNGREPDVRAPQLLAGDISC
ncbi:hypothetical protein ACFVUN_05965 [Kitasatospora griseola]|uniref:hypothetical protein n=1 Tax=Kitasatospora griseola TaxID=2064 RepID=UPI0036DED8F8